MPTTAELLTKTSRTFALAIPLLPEPTRTSVCLSYLLFRIADTLEDAEAWPRARRLEALAQLADVLKAPEPHDLEAISSGWLREAPTHHESYLELLRAVPQVFAEVARVAPRARALMLAHALRTTEGMAQILRDGDEQGRARIVDLAGLQAYCYIVAGIVGELLTELFLHDAPSLERVAATLRKHQRAFGEGLQLVNILKDEKVDASEGRSYLPAGISRDRVMALATRDLACARGYTEELWRWGPPGFYAFTALSEQLAVATLEKLEEEGAGAKISRTEVFAILARVQQRASAPRPPPPTASRAEP